MEKGSVRSLDSTICIKQYLIQQQLAKGHRHLLMLRQNIGGNEDFLFFFFLFFLATSYWTPLSAAASGFRSVTGNNPSMRNK